MYERMTLEGTFAPRTGDSKRHARRLNVDEQPITVESGTSPLTAGERTKIDIVKVFASTGEGRFEHIQLADAQNNVVLGKGEGFTIFRQADEALGVGSTIFAHDRGTGRRQGNVILAKQSL